MRSTWSPILRILLWTVNSSRYKFVFFAFLDKEIFLAQSFLRNATYNFGSSIFSTIETNSAKGACKTMEKCELMVRRLTVHLCPAEELFSRREGRVGSWGGESGNSNLQDGGPLRCSHSAHCPHYRNTQGETPCCSSWRRTWRLGKLRENLGSSG